jgi:hypothetical protein
MVHFGSSPPWHRDCSVTAWDVACANGGDQVGIPRIRRAPDSEVTMETAPRRIEESGLNRDASPAASKPSGIAAGNRAAPRPVPEAAGPTSSGRGRTSGAARDTLVTGLAWAARSLRYLPTLRRALARRWERRFERAVEGMRDRTDARRGSGVFDKVVAAARRLRREGVIFGLSLTLTRENAEEILSDDVVDLFFGELGAFYAWIFHYMPIGRAFTLDLMPTPDQRVRLWRRMWTLVRERGTFLVDFWSSGTVSGGCVAGGRPGGYLYIDWNGAVSPCVFIPYTPVNIQTAYRDGKTLDEVWEEPFFAGIRAWQRGYGYREGKEARLASGNWLAPCLIRDHHADFTRLLREHRPVPSDEDARAALLDSDYHAGLEAFDEELADATGPIWAARYAGGVPPDLSPERRNR